MPRTLIRAATTIAILVVVVACGSPAPSGTAAPSVAGSPSPAAPSAPSAAAPSATPAPTASPSAEPPATPAPTLTAAESALVEAIRADARVDCVPRRTDLPSRATLGVECHPAASLVGAVGVYGFDDGGSEPEPALATYLDRMTEAGVDAGSGDCAQGISGDRSWPSYLPDEGEAAGELRPTRLGCFLNENGIANVRLTCYGDIYIGVLGRTKELAELTAWTWQVAEGEDPDRDPPGLCARPD